MSLVWSDSIDNFNWDELAALYHAAPLGQQIVERLVELSRGHKKIILYAVPGKEPFYRRFGFWRMRTAMAIFADQPLAAQRGYLDET